jgi:hypothetical protein
MFENHQPGEPYVLTREQFIRFVGLPVDDAAADVRIDMWAAIAYWEARRTFNPLSSLCHSELGMNTRNGWMVWEYQTTSGTQLRAQECRKFLLQHEPGYPGVGCSDQFPEPRFTVIIPVDRDQPGRYHYQQLREGGAFDA